MSRYMGAVRIPKIILLGTGSFSDNLAGRGLPAGSQQVAAYAAGSSYAKVLHPPWSLRGRVPLSYSL